MTANGGEWRASSHEFALIGVLEPRSGGDAHSRHNPSQRSCGCRGFRRPGEIPDLLEHQLELRRRSRRLDRRRIGLESEVRGDAHDDGAFSDERHETPTGAAVIAAQDVDTEHTPYQLGPQVAVHGSY